jgi:tRNA threonylcarbamoyladenosine biosynthesis protein TsaE
MKKQYFTNFSSVPQLASKIFRNLKNGQIFALIGEMGSGKTAFVKKLGKLLGVKSKIKSPTFGLMHVHKLKIPKKNIEFFFHLDLYRLKNWSEIQNLGITELFEKKNSVIFIEWANKMTKHLPSKTIRIYFNQNEKK